MAKTETWRMPRPNIGDIVVFSRDLQGFSEPVVGFVMEKPSDSTITILTFNRAGQAFVESSCHHKDDPALLGDHGWEDFGVWDFSVGTNTINSLSAGETSDRRKPSKQPA
jgi:hypothetical protein